jgi:hypothetical protein
MNRTPLAWLLAGSFLAACTTPRPSIATSSPPSPTLPPARPIPTRVEPTTLPRGERVVLVSSSISIIVDDPAAALAAAQDEILRAGGYVESASSYAYGVGQGYASLTARLLPDSLAAVRRAILAMGDPVQNDSTYGQDVTAEYRRSLERLAQLRQADLDLRRLLTSAPDDGTAASLFLLRDLLERESQSLEAQLIGYEQRSAFATLSLNLSQPALTPPPTE